MIDIVINFIKNIFIKDKGKEKPSMEALHNMSIPMDTGDDVAKALGHMDEDGEFITEGRQEQIKSRGVIKPPKKRVKKKFDEV